MNKISVIFFCVFLAACINNKSFEGNSEYEAAKNGNVDAQYNVAMNFLVGDDGFPKNERKAIEWFLKASDQGDAGAQNGLGIIYLRGMGVKSDLIKSEFYYRKAALQGHENAQLQLGLILLDRDINSVEAMDWIKKAALQGNKQAADKIKTLENK